MDLDLSTLTVADMPAVAKYVETRFHSQVRYESPLWTILAPSGRVYWGLSLVEACFKAECGEPSFLPECAMCTEPFTHEHPWVCPNPPDPYYHAECWQEAQREAAEAWDSDRLSYQQAVRR